MNKLDLSLLKQEPKSMKYGWNISEYHDFLRSAWGWMDNYLLDAYPYNWEEGSTDNALNIY